MPASSRILALAAAASTANAAFQGFNYGATLTTGQVKVESDYEAEFKAAANLAGTNGAFSSARIYTMIVCGSSRPRTSFHGVLTNTTARRDAQPTYFRHPRCHQDQDQPSLWAVGFGWRGPVQ
jgi:hypothetical protein